jgi:hypothetical protein
MSGIAILLVLVLIAIYFKPSLLALIIIGLLLYALFGK